VHFDPEQYVEGFFALKSWETHIDLTNVAAVPIKLAKLPASIDAENAQSRVATVVRKPSQDLVQRTFGT